MIVASLLVGKQKCTTADNITKKNKLDT